MVTVTINQALHLPWLGVFERMAKSDVFVFLDDVQFIKNDFYNRNRIKTQQGARWITVPVKYSFRQIQSEVEVDHTKNWQAKNFKTIESNYLKAPFFSQYRDSFQSVYQKHWDIISDYNIDLTTYLAEQFGIATELVRSSTLGVERGIKRTTRLVEICEKFKATTYFSGQGGSKYLEENLFSKRYIKVIYQDFQHPIYPQLFGEFIPELSAIDLLFNCGPKSLQILLGKKT